MPILGLGRYEPRDQGAGPVSLPGKLTPAIHSSQSQNLFMMPHGSQRRLGGGSDTRVRHQVRRTSAEQ
jgi:hypothetical protein